MAFCTAYSQNETVREDVQVSGAAAITSNGISLVPNFSLEQPAAIFNLNLYKGNFSFEPEFTFSLQEGRPWYQLYWLRYRIIDEGRFKLRTGTHLGLNFIKVTDITGNESIQTERYLVGELAPCYQLADKYQCGYFITYWARGFDIDTSDPLHFLTLNATFNNLSISKTLYLEFTPEIYYVSSFGDGEGSYVTALLKLSKVNFPLSISSRINQAISTQIEGREIFCGI